MAVEWLGNAMGVVGAIGFALMLVPQARLNAVSQSTKGMSLGMIGLWHLACILSTAYFALEAAQSVFAILSFVAFALVCCVLEAQVVAYNPSVERSPWGKQLVILVGALGLFGLSALGTAVLTVVFFASHNAAFVYLVGNLCPSILLAVGFFPQYYTFIRAWSIEGYSFGVTVIDVIGSSANTAGLFLAGDGRSVDAALKASAPFLAIIVGHVVLVTIAVVITGHKRLTGKADQPKCSAADGADLEEGSGDCSTSASSDPTL